VYPVFVLYQADADFAMKKGADLRISATLYFQKERLSEDRR
jgi:hypothetical protein